jgi:hypothetical protein
LELAKDLGNVSKARKIVGYSRERFYQIHRNYQTLGAEGLVDRVAGPNNPRPNRLDEAVAQAILGYCLQRPSSQPVHARSSCSVRHQGEIRRRSWRLAETHLVTKHERLLGLE